MILSLDTAQTGSDYYGKFKTNGRFFRQMPFIYRNQLYTIIPSGVLLTTLFSTYLGVEMKSKERPSPFAL